MSTIAIEQLYLGFLGRPATYAELQSWTRAESGHGPFSLKTLLFQSPDYQAALTQGNGYVVDLVYQNLFGHAPDADGKAYWAGLMDDGKLAAANLPEVLVSGARGTDATVLRERVAAAESFSAALDLRSEVVTVPESHPEEALGKAWMKGIVDNASLDTAFHNLYETVTGGVEALIPIPAGGHMSVKAGAAMVEEIYISFFGRPADAAGLAYWEDFMLKGGSQDDVRAAFAKSPEFGLATMLTDHAHLVNGTYMSLFGHGADVAGLTYWTNLLDTHQLDLPTVGSAIAAGALGADAEALRAKIIAATAYSAVEGVDGMQSLVPVDPNVGKAWLATVTDDASLNLALDTILHGGPVVTLDPIIVGQPVPVSG